MSPWAVAFARDVDRARDLRIAGRHADGGNLYLFIQESKKGSHRRWVFLYRVRGAVSPDGLTSGPVHHLVDPMTWNRYFVPGSDHLEVLKRNSRVEFGHLVLMSADGLRASGGSARKALQAHGEALFGDWPL